MKKKQECSNGNNIKGEKEMKDLLSNTIQEVVVANMQEMDIKAIFKAEIEKTTKRIASDLFGEYGDFRKQVKEHLEKTLAFNIAELSVPDFGNFAIATVQAELIKIQNEEKERIEKEVLKNINQLLGTHKEPITLLELQNIFALSIYEKYIKDEIEDSCYCEERDKPRDLQDVIDLTNDYNRFKFQISEKEWGIYGRYCTTHINLSYSHDKDELDILLHVSRQSSKSERDSDFYKEGENNFYKILDVKVNGSTIEQDGLLLLKNINEETTQALVARFINGGLIDASKLSDFELVMLS